MHTPVPHSVTFVFALLTALAGCTKETETTSANATRPSPNEASPAESPDPASLGNLEEDINQERAATTVATTPAGPVNATPLNEQHILDDPNGQWATTARASSTYAQSSDLKAGYSAWQATGAPNVDRYSDSPVAWASKSGDASAPDWLEVGFATPVHATSIRVRQTAAPGAISRIELIDDLDVAHIIWEGIDETPYAKDTIGWLVRDVPKTSYLVKGARITLETARVWGWNEIDAIQLVGEK
jgi:hypothetical protein